MKILQLSILCISMLLPMSIWSKSLSEKLTSRRNKSASKVPAPVKSKMKAGIIELKKKGLAQRALGVGKKLPAITLINLSKKSVSLNELIAKEMAVITFYRGGWCPYCMLELDHYQAMISDFEKIGVKIVAISPDSPLESKKTKKKRNLSFSVLSDPENKAAKLLGLAFKVDKDTLAIYKKFGINLKKSQGNTSNELPMPGTYLVDKKGIIRFSFVDPDYTKRAEPSVILKIAEKLSKTN